MRWWFKQACGILLAALVVGLGTAAWAGTATITAGDGTGVVSASIPISINLTALDLAGVASVDGVTLNFSASSPGLSIVGFTPGALLSGWIDVTNRPPFPSSAWSYVTFGGGITGTGNLGTLSVLSNTVGTYAVAFDVTTAGVRTEVAGGGTTFTLATAPGSVTVTPEPGTLLLMGIGTAVVRCWTKRRR